MITENNNKQKLYWLINQYLEKKLDAWSFCNEYHDCYDVAIDLETLTPLEAKVFSELSIIASRFSNIEEDLKKYPGVYVTETELLQAVLCTTKNLLR